jgi:hypothetical protein
VGVWIHRPTSFQFLLPLGQSQARNWSLAEHKKVHYGQLGFMDLHPPQIWGFHRSWFIPKWQIHLIPCFCWLHTRNLLDKSPYLLHFCCLDECNLYPTKWWFKTPLLQDISTVNISPTCLSHLTSQSTPIYVGNTLQHIILSHWISKSPIVCSHEITIHSHTVSIKFQCFMVI